MLVLKKIWSYITFWKKSEKESNLNLRVMHGINRISILMFIIILFVMLFRYIL